MPKARSTTEAAAPADARPHASSGTDWRTFPPLELPVILQSALDEIVEHGYDATSVRTIAARTGVTVPTLYYHYENKQAILVALIDHAMSIVNSHVEGALADAGEDPVDQLSAVIEAICLYRAYYRDLAVLDSERRSLTDDNRAQYLQRRDGIDRILDTIIETGCNAGVFATTAPKTARRAILSMCQGIATWYRRDGRKTPEQVAAEHVRIALAALECTRLPAG